jgi:predicted MFS family arabinose efflux permease
MTQDVAVLAAGVVGFVLSQQLSPAALDQWGWRAAFLVGAAVIPVGLHLRRSLPETLHAADPAQDARSVSPGFVALALMLMLSTSVYLYGLDYITTYAQDSLKFSPAAAFGATVMVGLFSVAADPLSGLASDRFGRKPVMLAAVAFRPMRP